MLISHPYDKEVIEGIVDLILETIVSKSDPFLIASERYPGSLVKSKLLKLNYMHIEYVLDCFKGNTTKVKNIKKYLLAWLTAMAVVRIGCVAKGLASSVLLFILVGTLIWFRTEWMRYILLAIAEGILFAMLFAGAIVEVTLAGLRAKVGSIVFMGI